MKQKQYFYTVRNDGQSRSRTKNRIDALEMWCWRKMLGVSWREHRTNKSILEELDVER